MMAEKHNTRSKYIWAIYLILFLLGAVRITIGTVFLIPVLDTDVNKILNIITIFSLGHGEDIKILTAKIIAIGIVIVLYALIEAGHHIYNRKTKNKDETEKDQLLKCKIKRIGLFFGILITSTLIVFGLWIHINIKIKEDESKDYLLENMKTYFTEDADEVSNLVSFPNSWSKIFMELDCCAVNPVFSTTNDFDNTPWCTTSGECQQTNSQIPKTCCKDVTVSTYSSAPLVCHANVDSGTYNTKGCYEVLRDKIVLHSYVVIGYFILEMVVAVVAVVVLVWINNNTKVDNTNHQQCKVCKKEGHVAGSVNCESYVKQDDNVVVIKRHDVLSNSFTVNIEIDGRIYRSAENAYQEYEKLENININAMNISDREKRQKNIMKRVLQAKFKQIELFREKVTGFGSNYILVEASDDMFWGSGLNEQETRNTKHNAWPGKNMLGKLILSLKHRKRRKSSNVSKDIQ
ncbi:uncharacterized protein LOC134238509 isoform X2 [Saccostrea cucullata]